jgi:uncharacterized membrane protein YeiH
MWQLHDRYLCDSRTYDDCRFSTPIQTTGSGWHILHSQYHPDAGGPAMPLYELQMIGTAVFAVTGVLAVNRRGLDVFGALVLGTIASLGGGTIRDLIVHVPIFWLQDLNYVWVAAVSASVAFFANRWIRNSYSLLLYLDALGAALFGVVATKKVLALHHGATVAVTMGVLTSIGGGLIRDVLAGRPTLLMSREVYATPILIGCTLYALLRSLAIDREYLHVFAVSIIFCVRASAIYWHIEMPGWLSSR